MKYALGIWKIVVYVGQLLTGAKSPMGKMYFSQT